MRFVGKSARSIEHRRTAFATEAACVAGAALIGDEGGAEKLPTAILLPNPRRERRSGCTAAAVAMAVANPIWTAGELEYASSAQASASKDLWVVGAQCLVPISLGKYSSVSGIRKD
jgi:hypothetical protein